MRRSFRQSWGNVGLTVFCIRKFETESYDTSKTQRNCNTRPMAFLCTPEFVTQYYTSIDAQRNCEKRPKKCFQNAKRYEFFANKQKNKEKQNWEPWGPVIEATLAFDTSLRPWIRNTVLHLHRPSRKLQWQTQKLFSKCQKILVFCERKKKNS